MKVILSLYDSDCSMRRRGCNYLNRSSLYFRETVNPPLPNTRNHIDRYVRLVFTAQGLIYCNEEAVGVSLLVRRVLNIFYDKSFAELLYREIILHHASVT